MRFVVSYPQTNWDYVRFRLNRIMRGEDRSNDVFKGSMGGKIQLLEHDGSLGGIRSLAEIHRDKPFGTQFVEGEGLYFLTGLPCPEDGTPANEHIVRLNEQGIIDLEIRHPWFSQLRSIRRTERGLMVTSSGVDAILEVSLDGKILWSWWATEHGYDQAHGGGTRRVDKQIDHRLKCYPGRMQTTHMNSAIVDPYDPSKIITILFYQGKVARIDRDSLTTEVVVEGLSGPHHIRPHSKGYLLANSRKGQALLLDRHFRLRETIQATNPWFPVKWVQDAIETPYGSHLIADCNTFRLRERSATGQEKSFKTHIPNRIFQIEPVSDSFTFPQ
ncbi:MAG: RHS repeat protein [Methylococcales bacterium]